MTLSPGTRNRDRRNPFGSISATDLRRLLLFCLAFGLFACGDVLGQDPSDDTVEMPLYQRDPFDRITLDRANRNATVDVYPLGFRNRMEPVGDIEDKSFRIRRVGDPADKLFDVSGAAIQKIELFHELLHAEASRLIQAEKPDDAFPYLDRLVREFPKTQGIDKLIEDFHLVDAELAFKKRRFDEALLALDHAYTANPDREGLRRQLQGVVGHVIRSQFDRQDYAAVRRSAAYARDRYGAELEPVARQWETRLKERAGEVITVARKQFGAGQFSKALATSRVANRIWPDLEGSVELNRQIMAQHPRVAVGVTQQDGGPGAAGGAVSLNWAARRTSLLLYRPLVRFVDFTADGGVYGSPLGSIEVSSDRRQVTLKITGDRGIGAVGYEVSRALLRTAAPGSNSFNKRWAEFVQSVYLSNPDTIEITFSRPTLRPEALLPRPTPQPNQPLSSLLAGNYRRMPSEASSHTAFTLKEVRGRESGRPKEIVEYLFDDAAAATDALLRGEIDLIDRVHPADVERLQSHPQIQVAPYRIPTVHFLVVGGRQKVFRQPTFRRGLLYCINREGLLNNEILPHGPRGMTQVLTAPMPLGNSSEDPLGYAYVKTIEPRKFDPSLGLVLLRLAQAQVQQQEQAAKDKAAKAEAKKDAPKRAAEVQQSEDGATPLPSLVLAFPDSAIAQSASSAIASDLARVGLRVTLLPLPPGRSQPSDDQWDLLYVDATLQEPFVDLPELIIGHGLLQGQGGPVWQAVRTLQEAKNWDAVREQFAFIHRLVYDHTPLIPLWQIEEHLAYRDHLHGVGANPVSLYQNVDQWRLRP